jgi:hypothetical protein
MGNKQKNHLKFFKKFNFNKITKKLIYLFPTRRLKILLLSRSIYTNL